MPTHSTLLAVLAVLAAAATGCHRAKLGQVPTMTPRDTTTIAPAPRATPLTSRIREKEVRAKRPPGTLVAVDNSVCAVDDITFRETQSGDRVTCVWSGGTY